MQDCPIHLQGDYLRHPALREELSLKYVGLTLLYELAQDCWPDPEVAVNLNTDEPGDLGLTPAEEAAIVAFLKTLSDSFVP